MKTIAMKPTELLSAQLIDILFADRNKSYGAYQLRKSYSKRVNTALLITLLFAAAAFGSAALASGGKKKNPVYKTRIVHDLKPLPEDKPKEQLPEPERRTEAEPVETRILATPEIVEVVEHPMPDQETLATAEIGAVNQSGKPSEGIVEEIAPPGDSHGIIAAKNEPEEDKPLMVVEVNAKFIGNWVKFLLNNLNAQVPIDNNAGPGRYSVVIQFVVDKEGNVSEINPLTHHGFGLEEEAVRVIKKAPKWEPAIQNGYKVKAYHRQVITFDVQGE